MTKYKSHYACFDCRKTFKRRLLSDIQKGYDKNQKEIPSKCPECSGLMANMGLDFESPKKTDKKAWNHIATLYKVDITFHSCGCSGPGYIPNDNITLIRYFEDIKAEYIKHQQFWARRKQDPSTESDIAKDKHHNAVFLNKVPQEIKTGTRNKPKYDAVNAQLYWNERIQEIENKLKIVNINMI